MLPYTLIQWRDITEMTDAAMARLDLDFRLAFNTSDAFNDRQRVC